MQPKLIFKKFNFPSFYELRKMRSLATATFKNPIISLLIEKNLEVQPKTNTQKIPTLNIWKDLCPYLSFTVENGYVIYVK